jgi:hypothetical protein
MAVSDFVMAPECAEDLAKRVDLLHLRFDTLNGNKRIWGDTVDAVKPHCEVRGLRGRERWNRWNWREQLIRSLDPVKPDIVLFPDSDEMFHPRFGDDLQEFIRLEWEIMAFDFEMATIDGREVPKYPKARHCKAFRWVPRLGYRPYQGYAKPTWPGKYRSYQAQYPIRHLCFYTPMLQETKVLHK